MMRVLRAAPGLARAVRRPAPLLRGGSAPACSRNRGSVLVRRLTGGSSVLKAPALQASFKLGLGLALGAGGAAAVASGSSFGPTPATVLCEAAVADPEPEEPEPAAGAAAAADDAADCADCAATAGDDAAAVAQTAEAAAEGGALESEVRGPAVWARMLSLMQEDWLLFLAAGAASVAAAIAGVSAAAAIGTTFDALSRGAEIGAALRRLCGLYVGKASLAFLSNSLLSMGINRMQARLQVSLLTD